MQKIVGIQYLRAIAALGVVAAHASGRFGEAWILGVAGVDMFFQISGFMMIFIANSETKPKSLTRKGFNDIRVLRAFW